MKKLTWICLIVAGMMLAVGCGEKTEEQNATQKAAEEAKEGAKAVAEKTGEVAKAAVEEGKEAASAAVDWTKEKMDEYLGKMGEQLNGFTDKFKDISAKAEGLTGDAKTKFDEQFVALTEKKEAASSALDALKGSSGDTWTAAKEKFDTIMTELVALYEKMVASFKE